MGSTFVDELIDSIAELDLVTPGRLTLTVRRLTENDITELVQRVHLDSNERRWQAAIILSCINNSLVLDTMRQLLTANHPFLGHIAFDTLERYAPHEDTQTFLMALPSSIATLQPRLVRLIEKRGDKRAVPILTALLTTAQSSLLRSTIIQALGVLGDNQIRATIEPYIDDNDQRVRKRAMIALEQLIASER